jgi:LCP family protein required for cell wall assembly
MVAIGADHTLSPVPEDDKPEYKVYRSRPRLKRGPDAPPPQEELRELRRDPQPAPEYDVHRARPGFRLPRWLTRRHPTVPGAKTVRRLTVGMIVGYLLKAAFAWILLSAILFLVSAQIQETRISSAGESALSPTGYTLTTPNTILVLGSDARTKGLAEPGSKIGGPSRADSILLLRAGGGAAGRLSIPRDTVVDIPGHGRAKINAALAIGGTGLMVNTVEQYLGTEVNHVVEVDFANFPALIDAMGGVDIRTGCVISRINGGFRNGGYTLRLRGGESHIDGKQALALARTRKNECRPSENDLTRARRQQKIFAAIKSRLLSVHTFIRLPWVSWRAPQAVRSDMAGPSLLGLFGAIATGGDPKTSVLKPSGGITLPDGGAGLVVDEAEKRRAVRRLLRG